jgi:hypothetical protein
MSLISSPSTSAPFDAPHLEVNVLIVGLITGILLYIIGSIMERHELAQRDRESEERWAEFDRKYPGYRKQHPD